MTKLRKTTNPINMINEILTIARSREIVHLYSQDKKLDGRTLTIKEKSQINFGSCSYLGLELDERIIEAGIDGLRKFGSQFSSSRTYVSLGLYEELESLLGQMFERPVILSSCSSLGHHAIIPIIIEEKDAVILDQQAHVSMQEAVCRAQLKGTTVAVLRHNRLDDLQNKINELSANHNKIWYFIDGIYSMYGDLAPVEELIQLLDKNKQLYLYVDDAHGMSWRGIHGTGFVKSQIDLHPKMVLATSLAKGFASAGGVFILPNDEMYWKVKNWGGALTYSGPQQPAVLAASIASAKIHLSDEIYDLQNSLAKKIQFCNDIMKHYELPLVAESPSPLFFIGLGLTKVGYNMVRRLSDDGYYVNLGIFPAVPETCTGIRFTITNHLRLEDIAGLAECIHFHLPKALEEEERSIRDVHRAFKSLTFKEKEKNKPENNATVSKPELKLQHEVSIKSIKEDEWNELLGDNGAFDWKALNVFEKSFRHNSKQENNWEFHYYIVRDKDNKPVVATFFTLALTKDDMLASEDISRHVEQQRLNDPYFLTSKTFMMGTMLTDGEHLYIDKSNPLWKEALMLLLDEVWAEQERQNAGTLYLRDFNSHDMEIRDFLIDQGFVKVDLPDTHVIDSNFFDFNEDFVSQLPYKKRYHIKHDVLNYESLFEINIIKDGLPEDIEHWFELYKNVKERSLELNTFTLPKRLFYAIAHSPDWEVTVINFKKEYDDRQQRMPIAFGFAYKNQNYHPLLIGMDYTYLNSHKLYKQMLYQFVLRAWNLKSQKVFLGLTASLEKRKLGAMAISKSAYIQVKDNYNMAVIGLISTTKDINSSDQRIVVVK